MSRPPLCPSSRLALDAFILSQWQLLDVAGQGTRFVVVETAV